MNDTPLIAPRTSGEKSFSNAEVEAILLVAEKSMRDEVFIRFALATGLRRDDLARVEIKDIDLLNQKFIYVEKKKRSRKRIIYLGDRMTNLLKKYFDYVKVKNPKQKRLIGWSSRHLWNVLARLCEDAGVPFVDRGVHVLRATAFQRMYEAGWTMEELCRISGDTERTLRKHYLNLRDVEFAKTARNKEVY